MCVQMMYNNDMRYEWNSNKNDLIKKERNISFEKIIFHLSKGDVWKTSFHPDQNKYPGQKIYYVIIDDFIYLVPHIIGEKNIFLKTVIPSRKATQLYKRSMEE